MIIKIFVATVAIAAKLTCKVRRLASCLVNLTTNRIATKKQTGRQTVGETVLKQSGSRGDRLVRRTDGQMIVL